MTPRYAQILDRPTAAKSLAFWGRLGCVVTSVLLEITWQAPLKVKGLYGILLCVLDNHRRKSLQNVKILGCVVGT